jgi:hypothetical protein
MFEALLSLSLVALAVPAAHPSHPKTSDAKALAKAEVTLLDNAIADLKKEYAAHLKDPHGSDLRAQSSYFVDHPVQFSPESVLDAIDRVGGDDPRGVAYVRWQLLSGAPDKFEAKQLKRALAVYEKAPAPPARFGLSPDDQAKLEVMVLKSKQGEDSALSVMLEERVKQDAEANKPILAYRSALYARLPVCYESLVAGFRDTHERTQAAAGGGAYDAHAAQVVKDALAWAQSGDADPDQCGRLAETVARLRFVRSPPYYSKATWRIVRPSWSTRTDGVYSPKKLETLVGVLREAQKVGQAQQAAHQASQRKARTATGKKN